MQLSEEGQAQLREARLASLREYIRALCVDSYIPPACPGNYGDLMLRAPTTWGLLRRDVLRDLEGVHAPADVWKLWIDQWHKFCTRWRAYVQAELARTHLRPEPSTYEDSIAVEEWEVELLEMKWGCRGALEGA